MNKVGRMHFFFTLLFLYKLKSNSTYFRFKVNLTYLEYIICIPSSCFYL
jgi:hypothetical protein